MTQRPRRLGILVVMGALLCLLAGTQAMASALLVQQGATPKVAVLMVDSTDHITGEASLTPTVTISKNGGAFAAPDASATVAEVGGAGNGLGWYVIQLTAADTATLGPLIVHATSPGADPADVLIQVVAFNPGAADLGVWSNSTRTLTANPGLTAGQIATAVWDALTADHAVANTTGKALTSGGTALTQAQVKAACMAALIALGIR